MAGTNNEITTTFRADISQFSDSISSLKRYISTVNSEFKVATKGSSDWAKSQDGLKAKITQLNRTLQAQEQIVAELEKEYDKVAKEQGENSEAAQKLTIEINKYRASIDKTKSSIEKYNKSLNQIEKEAETGGKSLDKLGKSAKDAGDGFTVAKGAIAGFIANGLTALVGAAKNAITSIAGLADATREYRKTLSTLETVAEDVGVSTDYIKEKFIDVASVIGDEDTVTEGLANLLNAGIVEEKMDEMVQAIEGGAIRFKDTLKFEGIADGLQETLATGSAVGPFAEMLERSSVNLETFDEGLAKCTTEAEKQNYVLDQLSKLGLTEVSKSYREQNAQMIEAEKANKQYQDTVAKMGERIEPITTKIREGFTKILEKMLELIEDVDMEAFGAKIEKAFDGFINEVLPKIINGIQWVIDNKEIIGAIAGTVLTIAAALKILNTVLAIQSMIMAANPTTWIVMGIVAAITALIAIIMLCVKHWDKIKEAGQKAWAGIKEVWSKAKQWFAQIGESIKNTFLKAWESLKNGAKNAWEGVKSIFSKVGSFFSDTFSKAWSKVKSIFSTGGKIFAGIKDGISSAFKNIVNGLIGGINKVVSVPFNAINKMLNKIRNVSILGAEPFKKFWGENPVAIPQIPKLAKGGVVDKATLAMIGEAGKEAVVPLEKNTQGLKQMAGMVAEELKLSGLGNVNVTYNNTFSNMPTTRYAMKKAMADSSGMYQLFKTMQGGV